MEVDPLAAEVGSITQDSQYNAAWAITKFNEVLNAIAILCRIPGLALSGPVTAGIGGSSVAMPRTYLRELYLATTPTYPQGVLIAPNLEELKRNVHPDDEGNVYMVAVDNRILHFRPKPIEAEVISLFFYGNPVELEAGDDFPAYIPPFLQKEIFLNYALKEAYLKIEDGIDGVMFNTQKYGGLAAGAIGMLQKFYPEAPKAKPDIKRVRVEF